MSYSCGTNSAWDCWSRLWLKLYRHVFLPSQPWSLQNRHNFYKKFHNRRLHDSWIVFFELGVTLEVESLSWWSKKLNWFLFNPTPTSVLCPAKCSRGLCFRTVCWPRSLKLEKHCCELPRNNSVLFLTCFVVIATSNEQAIDGMNNLSNQSRKGSKKEGMGLLMPKDNIFMFWSKTSTYRFWHRLYFV